MTSNSTAITAESKHYGEVALLSPDGRLLAVPGENNTVVVIDALTREPWGTYYGHQAGLYRRVSGTIKALAWLQDGTSLASGSTDGSIHIWHARIELTFPTMLGQEEFRQVGYSLIDLVAQHLYQVRLRSPYRPVSEEARQALELLPLPENGVTAEEIVAFFEERIQPYPTFGTGHPRGFGWIACGPDPMAVLSSLLAAALNPNCIGGDQSAIYLELTVLRWLKELVGFPTEGSAGLLVSGGTQATLICLMAARHADAKAAGWDSRTEGLQRYPTPLVLYTSEHTHHCIAGAVEVLGLGEHHLRSIASADSFHLDLAVLHTAVRRDREDGLQPFCVVANAGTTNTGAINPLAAVADFCEQVGFWFHVDVSRKCFPCFIAQGCLPNCTRL